MVVVMADRLKTELPEMLAEHEKIRGALERLGQAATKEGRPQLAYFAAKLLRHARMEEEVLYPAAIVLGEYLKSRLSPAGALP
jgi:geranylgeranyl pyrophosphate synthase